MSSSGAAAARNCCRQLGGQTTKRTFFTSPTPSPSSFAASSRPRQQPHGSRYARVLAGQHQSSCMSTSSTSPSSSRRRSEQHPSGRRWQTTDAAAAINPKIAGIVDQISQLTLLETADLVASLKSRLNIPDMSFSAPVAGGSASGAAGAATPAAAAEAEDEPAPAAQEKSLFTLKLASFDAAAKPKIIKEVKAMLGLSLVDSKKFVESAPKVLKEGVPKEEAEKIVATLKALGGVVNME